MCGVAGMAMADPAAQAPDAAIAPRIVAVQTWGGSASAPPHVPQTIRRITLHHQGEIWTDSTDVTRYLQRLQQWSRLTKRWADIPYHYVIAPDGQIYAARDEARPGDTNTEYDPRDHALIMLLGNFEQGQPSAAQLQATVELSAWLIRRHGLGPDAIAAHRDFSAQTLCPGKNLYAHLHSGWLQRAVKARLTGAPLPRP
ncbi:peptidoglycan recognition family protein [Rhodoferax sp.]|uniref:peptidoglycan recognition protein family protein n=1 Tax=Rhodoferax sp. TaxID=50421 RepID=UPI002744CE15|nr:peptidoglycan recognition family protein [Rhodoferax sp.]